MCQFSNTKGKKNNFYKLFRVTFHMIYSMSRPNIKAAKKHKNSVHKHNESSFLVVRPVKANSHLTLSQLNALRQRFRRF